MGTTSITRLYGLGLTPGKLRGLQRISNPNGTLTMVATDQNSSMIKMMKEATKKEPTYPEIADAKRMRIPPLPRQRSGPIVSSSLDSLGKQLGRSAPVALRLRSGAGPSKRASWPEVQTPEHWRRRSARIAPDLLQLKRLLLEFGTRRRPPVEVTGGWWSSWPTWTWNAA